MKTRATNANDTVSLSQVGSGRPCFSVRLYAQAVFIGRLLQLQRLSQKLQCISLMLLSLAERWPYFAETRISQNTELSTAFDILLN